MKKITINAENKKIGRVASEAATILQGKDSVEYAKNKVAEVTVEIINASKLDIDETKMKTKMYQTYSGHPGGRKEKTLGKVIEKKGYEEILKIAVRGMLPANRLRTKRLLNLTVTN